MADPQRRGRGGKKAATAASAAAAGTVRAARAFLQDPTRPVTPADESQSRRLLQSSCGYSNRPQTSGALVGSRDFLSAATSDGLCWGRDQSCGSSGSHTDIWVAEQDPQEALVNCSSTGAKLQANTPSTRCSLPGVRRATASAPTVQQLSGLGRGSSSSSGARTRTASAGGVSQAGRLAALGPLAPLRPGSALHDTGNKRSVSATGVPNALAAAAAVAASGGDAPGTLSQWDLSCSPAPSVSEGWLSSGEHSCSMQVAPRQESTSTDSSSVNRRPRSGGGPAASSRGSSSSSSRSRLSSGGSDKAVLHDSITAAEAELEQLLLEAADAADAARPDGAAPARLPQGQQSPASFCSQWQRDVLRVLQCMQALSLSPTDAPALLQHCSELQCLLNIAADWGCMQDWLSTDLLPADAAPPAATPKGMRTQPCADSAAGPSLQPSGAASANLQGCLLPVLIRLVDSKKPDVLVKVGAMLMGVTPPSSHMLLPAVKMLYSLSKTSSNDSLFRHHGVLRPLLQMTLALSSALAAPLHQQHTSTSLLYCSGCLKNISSNASNQKSLGRLGGVSTMAQVVKDQVGIAQAVAAAQQQQQQQQQTPPGQRPKHPQHEAAAQAAVQATAVLRNLAVDSANAVWFAQQQGAALQALVGLLQPFQHDPEVLLNASRCLSKLSTYDNCRQALLSLGQQPAGRGRSSGAGSTGSSRTSSIGGRPGSGLGGANRSSSSSEAGGPGAQCSGRQPSAVAQMARALLDVQVTQPQRWNTGIRLTFALGQLTTFHAEARPMVAAAAGALDALPQMILDLVQLTQEQQQQPQQQEQQQQQLAEDFMIKLLRVLANLSTDRTIGPALAAKQCTADALLAVLVGYGYDDAQELVLNATAAVTNLAFYDTPSNKVLQADADVLLVSLLALLTSGNEESMCEAAKAVGNLARASPAVRAQLVLCADTEQQARPLPGAQQQQQQQEQEQEQTVVGGCIGAQHVSAGPYVLQSLVLLLDHSSWEVVCSVAGALVNLAALPEAGAVLSRMELAAALTAALQRLQEAWEAEQQQQQQQQQGQDDSLSMQAAAELLLQCVGNMAAASAAAVSEAILGSSGARCAELSCSAEDLAGFSRVLDQYAECGMPQAVCQTAKAVQGRLAELWGV